jgi:hypothetical protein
MKDNFIGIDVHCKFSETMAMTSNGKLLLRRRSDTNIPALVEVIAAVPRPRHVVIEEGPLADWLYRNLVPHVDTMVVCNPRRNRLITQYGDKDDPLDAEKLANLFRGVSSNPSIMANRNLERFSSSTWDSITIAFAIGFRKACASPPCCDDTGCSFGRARSPIPTIDRHCSADCQRTRP